jgi:hexokinase
LESVLRSVGILRSDHLDESEATALAGVWVTHNVALLDSAVLLEEDGDLFLGQARVDASDEEVGTLVDVARVTTAGSLTLTAVALAAAVLARGRNVAPKMSV